MLEEVIKNFNKQFEYQPEIQNSGVFGKYKKFIICGVGGSNLAAGVIKGWKPKLDMIQHRDYGLPDIEESELKEKLIVLSSYSGNTEETISAFRESLARKLPLIVISKGGELLKLARENNAPYIQLPDAKTQPRFAMGFSIKATLKAMGEESILTDINGEADSFNSEEYKEIGKSIADTMGDKIPLIYSSHQNSGLSYFWKINFNETVKLPAFFNTWPELNHNEMIGFESKIFDGKLNHKFAFIFLNDPDDEPQIKKRMIVTKKVLSDLGFSVLDADLTGPSLWHKSFVGIATALWVSHYLAEYYGINPEDISMIESFKKQI